MVETSLSTKVFNLRARQQEDDAGNQDAKVLDIEGSNLSHDQAGGHEESTPWDQ